MKGADARVLKLWEAYKHENDHEAKKSLILEYVHLVKYTVGRMAVSLSPRAEISDLTNSGILGLIDAIEKFEIERPIKFETYAAIRIQGAILDHLRSLDWVPRTVRRKARTLEETYQALEHQLGRTPTEAEIAAHMNISLEDLHKLLGDVSETAIISLEDFFVNKDHHEISLKDTIEDQGDGPEDSAVAGDVKRNLAHAITTLPDKEKLVLSLHYFEELTLKEISMIMELSEARISQLHSQAILRLRGKLTHFITVS
ncbi:MAG: FliA/WhiG family RNA polymerase sigma factor [Armatimonadetes bacterium]|nr:FliA/WhiG family RNA polymerase sigma factor [Armatimonadota bacterium]